jgi:hypothetical protein
VNLTNETKAEGQLFQSLYAVFHRPDIVLDLSNVGSARRFLLSRFKIEQIRERRLRPFDSGAQYGFSANVGRDEQVRVGEQLSYSGEVSQPPIRFR